jgi:transcriptional regulator with XRE-family HTH domain
MLSRRGKIAAACYNAPLMGKTLAENLRRERKRAGLTQRALAERTGLSEISIIKLENGDQLNPTVRTIRLLARELGLGTNYAALIPPLGESESPDTLP